MRVLEFGMDPDGSSVHCPHNHIENSVCYVGTHDNVPIVGFLKKAKAKDLDYAIRYYGLNKEEGYNYGFIRGGMSSVSNGANASSGDSGVAFIFDEEIPGVDDMFGLTTSYGGGVNVNTDRIPGIETNININVKGSDKDSKTISNTKEYGTADTADHNTDAYSSILTGTKTFNGGIELKKKEKKKCYQKLKKHKSSRIMPDSKVTLVPLKSRSHY